MVGCINNTMDMSLSKLRAMMKDREARRAAVHGVRKSWTIKRLSVKELMLWNCGVGEDS